MINSFKILNPSDKTRFYTVVSGYGIPSATSPLLTDTKNFPLASIYYDLLSGDIRVRRNQRKVIADWESLKGLVETVIGEDDLDDAITTELWGGGSITDAMRQYTLAIPAPVGEGAWDSVQIKQVNNTWLISYPNGSGDTPETLIGNTRVKSYAYSAVSGEISEGALPLQMLVISGNDVYVEAIFSLAGALVSKKVFCLSMNF